MSMIYVHLPAVTRAALILGVTVLLAGCTGGDSDLREWVSAEKAKKGAPLPPLPVLKTFETFSYKDKDDREQERRDPFGPSREEQELTQSTSAGPQPDKHPKEPLETFPLDSLKMVGTIGLAANVEGLIKDPDNVIHRVHLRNYLGQNNGKITVIAEDHIDLVELVPNQTGGWMERQASIALGEK
jgi:type IV pilus assembly protein PilP